MQHSREIELKLEVPPGAAGAVTEVLGASGKAKRLLATYYDTPDGALRKAGISFRVRRTGDAHVQTIKVDRPGGGALFDRSEWDKTLPDATPDVSAIDEAGVRGALDAPESWQALRPAFTVDVERMAWDAEFDGGTAEVVLDRGSVLAGGAQDAVSEIELESRTGSPAALFELARRIGEAAPVRLGVLTKAERGHRLLSGRIDRAAKAEPLVLADDASTADAFASIVEACLRHFRLNEPLVARRDAAGLHQARVALRRLRSAISLFRGVVADDRLERLRAGLRGLAATLGEARNLDVLLDRLGAAADAETVAKLRGERDAAYVRATEALDSAEARLLMLDLLEWAGFGAWRTRPAAKVAPLLRMPAHDFAAETLDRYRRRVKKRGRALAALDPEARHQVRIEAKKLRYAAEFFTSLFGDKKAKRRTKAFLSALEELQSSLGALNDIATANEMAHELSARGITLPDAGGNDEDRLLIEAEAAHEALVDAKRFWR
jgi:inorganic triphosphatase YgiF